MKYSIISFKDKQVERYTMPSYSDLKDPEEIKEDCRIQIVKSNNRAVFKGKNLVLLGQFDSETGLMTTSDPEFLLNCDEIISECNDYERRIKEGQEN